MKPVERKMVITISGRDGEPAVDVSVKFDPPLPNGGEEPPASGWSNLASVMMEALQSTRE